MIGHTHDAAGRAVVELRPVLLQSLLERRYWRRGDLVRHGCGEVVWLGVAEVRDAGIFALACIILGSLSSPPRPMRPSPSRPRGDSTSITTCLTCLTCPLHGTQVTDAKL